MLLIGIVIYNNITGHGSPLTTYLLSGCIIINTLKGKTQLRIKLRRNHRADAVIFILLIGIVIYNNITGHGSPLTTYLLSGCIII
ncbi:hypothetical protein CP990_28570, partial [Escherichia coli]